jgi:FSR family fosmidomycin resistance protein-like MFS transporter
LSTTATTLAASPAEAAEPERFHTGTVTLVSFAHLIHDTYTAFLAPLLPAFIAKYGLSTTQAGLLTVFYQWPSLIQPYLGYLADRAGLRYAFILAPAITATMMCLLGVAPGYLVMTMFLVVAGVSSAALHALGPVIAGNRAGRSLGRAMSFWMVGGEAGRTLGPLVIVTAVSFLGLEGTSWLMVGGWLASGVLYLGLRNVPDRFTRGKAGLPWREALVAMKPLLLPLAGLALVRSLLATALTTFLPTFLSREGANLWLAGASLSVFQAAAVVGALAGGSLSDRWGRRAVLLVTTIAAPLLTLVFLNVSGSAHFPLLLLLGLTTVSGTPVVMAIVQESYPQNRALANGIYMAINFLTLSAAAVLMGLMGDLIGLRAAFYVSAGIFLLALPIIFALPQRSDRGTASPTP